MAIVFLLQKLMPKLKCQQPLEIILTNQPESITELAELSHRHKSNLSRTLRTMERYGLVELKKKANHFVPKVRFDRIEVDLGLFGQADGFNGG